ncbi:MAG: replication-associated recombination protein A [Bacteroidales bacterium]|nr:replication-associated recombination protein A [Bacteroidales bacterium]
MRPEDSASFPSVPLPERMRPRDLSEYVGQSHLVGPGCILRNMIDSGNLSSFILWGPPGVGKTTLASIIAHTLDREFYTLSAVSSGVKDVRDVIDKAKNKSLFSSAAAPVLFIDEIHRFNKAQQDALLGAVESGTVVLIGATTENPSFEVITPLLSRCQVFVLKSLEAADLKRLLERALTTDTELKRRKIVLKEDAALLRHNGGDARKLLNILEIVVEATPAGKDGSIIIDNQSVSSCLQENLAIYDKGGEMHYDIISAFIKSVRGSDPNAAVYWMARMLAGGEDPLFIARRLCILAAEDIGLANPNALLLADATFRIVHSIGMPEARIPLSECAVYLASSPKSNSAYMAIEGALAAVDEDKMAPVPLYLRNAPTSLMKELGYSDGYLYAHDFEGHFVDQEFMPEGLKGRAFYAPQPNAQEDKLKAYLQACWPKYYTKEK